MKYCVSIILAGATLFGACERPPVTKETNLDHNKMDHSKMDQSSVSHSKMESSPDAAKAPYDLQFLDTMILHHQGAVDMALLTDTRAQHTELKNLAKAIIADQQKEIAQMKRWREEWFSGAAKAVNMEFSGMRDGMKKMDLPKLDALKANDFDLEFIRQMIPHHEGAVLMAKAAVKDSERPELRAMAESIIKSQESEIARMRDWEAAWSK